MHSQIPEYSEIVMDYIKANQKAKLSALYGPMFENYLHEIFPSIENFLEHIEQSLAKEFGENSDERYT